VARDIAHQLQETNLEVIEQIDLIVQRLGVEKAQEFLQEMLNTEAEDGLLVRDGSRRRTPGGVYFYLVRGKVSQKDRWGNLAASGAKAETTDRTTFYEKASAAVSAGKIQFDKFNALVSKANRHGYAAALEELQAIV